MTVTPGPDPPQPPPKDTPATQTSSAMPPSTAKDGPSDQAPDAQLSVQNGSDMSSLSPLELHQLTQNLLDESASERPLVGDLVPLSALREEYERGSGSFVAQIDYLEKQGFTGARRARGDGDCFYRSFGYAWLERMIKSKNQTIDVAKALSLLESSLGTLNGAGFQELVYQDFYDVLSSLIRQILIAEPGGSVLTPQILLEAFQDPEVSNCIVVFLRFLTSATIRTDPDSYKPFLFHPETGEPITIKDFCERFVESTGKEADHIQITALTRVLKANIEIAYLDGHDKDGAVNFVSFDSVPPEDYDDPPVLLYRPGHYDILEHGVKK